MQMPIYIPSRSRARFYADGHTGRTLSWLPRNQLIYVVVPGEQVGEYAMNMHGRENIKLLGIAAKGIAATRRWIGEHAADKLGADRFLMLDDDLRFSARSRGTTKLHIASMQEMEDCLAIVDGLLDEHAAVGISARQGNNTCDDAIAYNTRLIRALGFRTTEFLECQHGRVPVMEDFDVLLQLLRGGRSNACIYSYAQDQHQTQATGGCSDYRTHEVHDAAARKLAELHPDFVRLREKRNKSGGEFGHRTEVTIMWKRAFESA